MYHIIHGIQQQAPNLVDRSALHNVKHTYFLSVADEAKTKILDTPISVNFYKQPFSKLTQH